MGTTYFLSNTYIACTITKEAYLNKVVLRCDIVVETALVFFVFKKVCKNGFPG
jgi:hypothetical protein